jgi:hypothetical protein
MHFKGEAKALIGLPMDSKTKHQLIIDKILDILYLYIDRAMKQDCPSAGRLELLEKHFLKTSSKCVSVCILIDRQNLLFDNIYSLISQDSLFEGYFFESLETYLLDNKLKEIPPQIVQNFIDFYSKNYSLHSRLEKCLFHFDILTLDLHSVIQVCRKYALHDAYIVLNNKAFNDYITPFEELIEMINPLELLYYDKAKSYLKTCDKSVTIIGNKLLVYLYSCLCGQSFPFGRIDDDQLSDKIRRTSFDFLTSKSSKMIENLFRKQEQNQLVEIKYPIMRIFLNFDSLDFLNVLSMAFNEASFEAVIGLDRKQLVVDILIEIGVNKTRTGQLSSHLFTFLARQVSNKNNNIRIDEAIFSQVNNHILIVELKKVRLIN